MRMTNCIVLIYCMCDILCVVRNCVYHHVCESKRIERVELLFGTHLRKSLVIEGMCDMLCVVRICASSHVCDSERYSYRESRAFLFGTHLRNH